MRFLVRPNDFARQWAQNTQERFDKTTFTRAIGAQNGEHCPRGDIHVRRTEQSSAREPDSKVTNLEVARHQRTIQISNQRLTDKVIAAVVRASRPHWVRQKGRCFVD